MSSRFVSGGKIDAESGDVVHASTGTTAPQDSGISSGGGGVGIEQPDRHHQQQQQAAAASKTNPEWEAVQQELEAERKRREAARIKAVEGGEKSLYDVLQANKAAKQAAFEEQNKIRNQFRALDDDEIDFLDEVRESQRKEEAEVRAAEREGLAAFRRAQKTGEAGGEKRQGDDDDADDDGEVVDAVGLAEWTATGPRKRKRLDKEGRRGGLVKRKAEGSAQRVDETKTGTTTSSSSAGGDGAKKAEEASTATVKSGKAEPPPPVKKPALGLGDYGSDSDDD